MSRQRPVSLAALATIAVLGGARCDRRPVEPAAVTDGGEPPPAASCSAGLSTCGAPCPGTWEWDMPVDTSDCGARPASDCNLPGIGLQGRRGLVEELFAACRFVDYTYVRVDFTSGCATRLLVHRASRAQRRRSERASIASPAS
jgi:hypothetical protein